MSFQVGDAYLQFSVDMRPLRASLAAGEQDAQRWGRTIEHAASQTASRAVAGLGRALGTAFTAPLGSVRTLSGAVAGLVPAFQAPTAAAGGLVTSLGRLGLAAGGIVALTAAARGLGEVLGVGAASDVAESVSKAGVVFGDSAARVTDFAATTAQALGLSRGEALATTGMFGNMFKTMGLGEDAAARMSIDITRLGADLASFHNIAGSDALDKLRAGLVGESEPLRALGVLLTEGAVKAKGMQLGLAGANGELSEAAKVQARYALILEQTGAAQGDFARTSTGLANSQRIIRASFEDIRTQIGERLLPVLTPLVSAFAQGLPGALRAAQPALDRFGQLVQGLGRWLAGPGRDAVVTFIGALSGTWRPAPGVERFHLLVGQIGRAVQTARDAVLTFIGAVGGSWAGQASDAITPLHQAIGKVGLAVRDYVVPALATLATVGGRLAAADVGGAVQALLAHIQRTAPLLGQQLGAWGQQLVDWVRPRVEPLLAEAEVLAGRLLGWIGTQAGPLLAALSAWGSSFQTWAAGLWRRIEPQIVAAGRQLLDWIGFHGPILAYRLGSEWVPAFVGWVAEAVAGLFGPSGKMQDVNTGLSDWARNEAVPQMVAIGGTMAEALLNGLAAGFSGLGKRMHVQLRAAWDADPPIIGPFRITSRAVEWVGFGEQTPEVGPFARESQRAVVPAPRPRDEDRYLRGYAHGGSFPVRGNGGIDSALVAFMATPGERVTITPPGMTGPHGSQVAVTINYPVVRDGADLAALRQETMAAVISALAEAEQRADNTAPSGLAGVW